MLIKLPRVDMFFVCRGGGGGGGGGVGGCRSGGSGGSGWWWVVVGGGGWLRFLSRHCRLPSTRNSMRPWSCLWMLVVMMVVDFMEVVLVLLVVVAIVLCHHCESLPLFYQPTDSGCRRLRPSTD